MTEIQIVRGDKNFILHFTIYNADNEVVDLTGASSIVLKFKNYENGSIQTLQGQISGDPEDGKVDFPAGETFVDLLGEFKAEIEITYENGKVITAPNISIKVIPDIT